MADVHTTTSRHRCPRCGSRLTYDEGSGRPGWLCRWLLLRHWSCTPECGWEGYRFSRSQFRRRKRQLRTALLIVLTAMAVVGVIWYALSRVSARGGATQDDGVQEVD